MSGISRVPILTESVRPDLVFPGAIVTLKGVVAKHIIGGIIERVHPPGTETSDVDGSYRVWNGRMPLVDVLYIDRVPVPPEKFREDHNPDDYIKVGTRYLSKWVGVPVRIEKVPWATDIERRNSFMVLPPALAESAPRYVVVGELRGV